MINATFEMYGLPELNAQLDQIANIVAGPIVREALKAGGAIIQKKAESLVRQKTGALAEDIVVVTRVLKDRAAVGGGRTAQGEQYVLIGPGWIPDSYRRVARNRGASGREAAADQTTNPGVYGYFLEVGHRAPGMGLTNDPQYRADASAARKQGKKVNTHDYGHLSTPPYPWLQPAFESSKGQAFEKMADIIRDRLSDFYRTPAASFGGFYGS